MAERFDVVVVGLGAMGRSVACQLATRGLRVLGLDAHRPPHGNGSHHGESRIIRKAYFEHLAYVPLLERAYVSWDALAERSGSTLLIRTGGLMIGREEGALVSGVLASAREHRLAHTRLGSDELMARYPAFRVDGDMTAVFEPEAGILLPERCITAFLDGARFKGAELGFSNPVLGWSSGADGVEVETSDARYAAAALVLTAGIGMPDLLPDLRAALSVERQVVAHFEPAGDDAGLRLGRLPIFCVEEAGGAFYYGFPDLGSGCKLGRHHGGLTGDDAKACREATGVDIADLRGFAARHLPRANGRLASSAVCFYTNTPDQHFVIDRHPEHRNVIVVSACSGHGFKFATVVGEIVADLVQDVVPQFDLSMFRIERVLAAKPLSSPLS
jgi:sarcosine oxidase